VKAFCKKVGEEGGGEYNQRLNNTDVLKVKYVEKIE
jgi:hypothetical protein